MVKEIMGHSYDLVVRELTVFGNTRAALLFLMGIVDPQKTYEQVIGPMTEATLPEDSDARRPGLEDVLRALGAPNLSVSSDLASLAGGLPAGMGVLFVDGLDEGVSMNLGRNLERQLAEPETAPLVRGPREGFVENVRTNVTLIRRRVRTLALRVLHLRLGRATQTEVCVLFVDGLAEPALVRHLVGRIEKVDVDGVLESGQLEAFIEDEPLSVFPTVRAVERPDDVSLALLEGRVAILVDGTPFALIVPTTLNEMLRVSEDSYVRFTSATLSRAVRYAALLIGLFLPSLYVALISFNQEMIPTDLALRIAQGREAVPFPAVVEAFLMEAAFEVLREAGLRMPRNLGQAVSIVGALVIGNAAVTAGLVSPLMIVVVGTTAVAAFAVPDPQLATSVRVLRFPMLILAGMFGLLGVLVGGLYVLGHLLRLKSFGVVYTAPYAPLRPVIAFLNGIVRAPMWALTRRPPAVTSNEVRLPPGQQEGGSKSESVRAGSAGGKQH